MSATQPTSRKEVTLQIDGQSITVPERSTILQATQILGVEVPIFAITLAFLLQETAACAWWKSKATGNLWPAAPCPWKTA